MDYLNEYKELGEPGKKDKAEMWQTAIGLQQVDGLSPSEYLIESAKENIDGKISIYEVKERINKYYESKPTDDSKTNFEEADKVSSRIVEILSEKTFNFSPAELLSIHKRLFDGVLYDKNNISCAGIVRKYNISKNEWVLNGKSVYYASAESIADTLKYDFQQEKAFDYKDMNKEEIVKHITHFISGIWQIHAFSEGNTRTIAVFAIKYLRTLGLNIDNELFEKNSWYFRNALVRANYSDYTHNIYSTYEYLNNFFANLLLGTKHTLKNRELKVYDNEDESSL